MKYRIAFLSMFAVSATLGMYGQSADDTNSQNNKKSFEEFRQGILSGYDEFRSTILEHYADFLNGEWHEYESLNGLKRDETPKPVDVPRVTPVTPGQHPLRPSKPDEPVLPPKPEKPTKPTKPEPPKEPVKPVKPAVPEEPKISPTPSEPPTPPAPAMPEKPQEPVKPTMPATPARQDGFEFEFYGMPMSINDIDFAISKNLSQPSDFASQWKKLDGAKVGKTLAPVIKKNVEHLGLNDYLTYKYVESYVNGRFPQSPPSSKMSLIHYLLAHLGYDVRIGVTSKGNPVLLIPFEKLVYGRQFLKMAGTRYYIFPPEGQDIKTLIQERISTCDIPDNVNKGDKFGLVLSELNLPVKPKPFDLEYGRLHLQGEVNENLMPILYRYPQMPMEDYAKSVIQPELRRNLAEQIRTQLSSLEDDDQKVEELLHFTQSVFSYATDDAYHGFEKPYFVEETLFYPKNDCEDRAIFYTYFLWNALGRESQLISFPGHEAASVVMDHLDSGTYYMNEGKKYFISDPTYIGAKTGMIMPNYSGVAPEIDYSYGKGN